jgi:hypothetical protein
MLLWPAVSLDSFTENRPEQLRGAAFRDRSAAMRAGAADVGKAFRANKDKQPSFISRGDRSGTHIAAGCEHALRTLKETKGSNSNGIAEFQDDFRRMAPKTRRPSCPRNQRPHCCFNCAVIPEGPGCQVSKRRWPG